VAFILSSGRTSTKFLAHYLDANYDGVIARHEPPPARLLRLAAHARLSGRLSDAALLRLLRRKRRLHVEPLAASGARLYVESNPFLATAADLLRTAFDEPLLVHVVRDPRDFVRSALNHGFASGWKALANRWLPFAFPDVAAALGLGTPLTPVERVAALWRLVDRRLTAQAAAGASYFRVHYEALFDAEHSGLRALCKGLGLDYRDSDLRVSPEQRINPGRLDVMPHWREWSAETSRQVWRLCGEDMARYGYGSEPEWLARVGAGE